MSTALTKPRVRIPASSVPTRTIDMASHDAADGTDPMLSQWFPLPASPDADLLPELGQIVGRSRDLVRNNGLASGYIQTLKDNVIGSVLKLSAKPDYKLLGWDVDTAAEWARLFESEFRSYADSTECDAGRTSRLISLTRQALGSAMQNGDAIALPVFSDDPAARWSTKFMLIEGDRLSTPPGLEFRKDIRGGVHIDRYGAPIGYWIRQTHPGDAFHSLTGWTFSNTFSAENWVYEPAFFANGMRRVIHLHDKDRAGASRAKPIFASVMKEFKMAGKYSQEELKSAVTNSLIAAFIESNLDQTAVMDLFTSGSGSSDPQEINNYWLNQFAQNRTRLQGGALIPLPIGAKVTGFNPGRPNPAFEAFMLSVLRGTAAGLNIPYELFVKDFSKSNYSSARAALIEAWRFFLSQRNWLIEQWLTPILELWAFEAVTRGIVQAPNFLERKHAYLRCKWIMSGRGNVDPLKEAKATREKLDADLTNEEIECANDGNDWEEVLEGKARVLRKKRELGLPIANQQMPGPSDSDDEDGEDDDDDEEKEAA